MSEAAIALVNAWATSVLPNPVLRDDRLSRVHTKALRDGLSLGISRMAAPPRGLSH
jgi:hypothetical protein